MVGLCWVPYGSPTFRTAPGKCARPSEWKTKCKTASLRYRVSMPFSQICAASSQRSKMSGHGPIEAPSQQQDRAIQTARGEILLRSAQRFADRAPQCWLLGRNCIARFHKLPYIPRTRTVPKGQLMPLELLRWLKKGNWSAATIAA